jgi:hypothetical protein
MRLGEGGGKAWGGVLGVAPSEAGAWQHKRALTKSTPTHSARQSAVHPHFPRNSTDVPPAGKMQRPQALCTAAKGTSVSGSSKTPTRRNKTQLDRDEPEPVLCVSNSNLNQHARTCQVLRLRRNVANQQCLCRRCRKRWLEQECELGVSVRHVFALALQRREHVS